MGMRVQDGEFKMQTGDKKIKPGKEVTVSYHNMPNAWLLNNYGVWTPHLRVLPLL